jgi:hypothetical protein
MQIMNETLITAAVMSAAVASVFVVGLCVATLIAGRMKVSCTSEQFWAAVPLVGTGVIILVAQNLLYLDVRMSYSAALIWGCVLLFTVATVIQGKFTLRDVPWTLLITGVIVYLVHASGLLVSGASNYYGYGWVDMYNYVAQAQFFIDFPFSQVTDSHEYVRVANAFKDDRIGQTVLHAFISATTGADAQQTFGATILLSPMLIFFALYLLATVLNIQRKYAYSAAIVGSLSPAVASVHLECFFSQAMAMPFVFLWPLALSRVKLRLDAASVLIAGMLWAVTAAIYTELIPALTLIAAIVMIVPDFRRAGSLIEFTGEVKRRVWWQSAAMGLFSLGLVVTVGVLSNVGYVKGAIAAMVRTTTPAVLGMLYPWAFKTEGLARLWTGHQVELSTRWGIDILAAVSAIAIAVALLYAVAKYLRYRSPASLLALLIACVPLAPLLLTGVTSRSYPYQFFKLLLTVWPLILFLAVCGVAELIGKMRSGGYKYFQLVLVCVCVWLTYRIAFAASNPATTAVSSRGGAHLLIDPDFIQMRNRLDRLEGQQVYIWWYDKALYGGTWRGRWLAYFARKNSVWSMRLIDPTAPGQLAEVLAADILKLPAVGISWKEAAVSAKEKIGPSGAGSDAIWLYKLVDDAEVRRVDQVARTHVLNRSMRLHIDMDTSPDIWYPLWVVGRPDAASLITINVGQSGLRFRYDQWGLPAVSMNPGAKCAGRDLKVNLRIDLFEKKGSLSCNGEVVQYSLPMLESYLGANDPLGLNRVTGALEGRYLLAERFPGKIDEIFTENPAELPLQTNK